MASRPRQRGPGRGDGAARTGGQDRERAMRLKTSHRLPENAMSERPDENAVVHCGWGRLIFADTFRDSRSLVETLDDEARGERDIAFYVNSPHVALSMAPQTVFLDPSHTFRLWLANYRPGGPRPSGYIIRRLRDRVDAEGVNRIYAKANMVQVPTDFLLAHISSRRLTYLVAEDAETHEIIGTVTGVDHYRAYNDPQRGASLWCLAADLQAPRPAIGEALVRQLAEHYIARGRNFLDLSVMHDNAAAIALYERLGFERIPQFALKRKNTINERLFTGAPDESRLNPYARIIVAEARRRGIGVEIEDDAAGLFRLSLGGRTVACRESLSDLTSAVAVQRCDDKALTLRLLARAGLGVPAQIQAGKDDANLAFLEAHGRIVVKPAHGEQGAGITVDVQDEAAMKAAIERAAAVSLPVLLEQFVEGEDLRVIVINGRVVAAAVRRAAAVKGNGKDDMRTLIEARSRRRAAATGGESRIPLDEETERCVTLAGYAMDSVPPAGEQITVRRTANLHTGGTIHDVTDQLHPTIVEAAIRAARTLNIPVVGLDFLVKDFKGPDYVIIEANERPGLANHEPQPTAERFVDLLFPQTASSRK